MNVRILTTNLVTEPAGAIFHRCALQVNPQRYRETFRGADSQFDPQSYTEAMIRKAIQHDITVLAVTDHNDANSIPLFRVAAEETNITILPGFELRSSEGIHVLCIYPPDTTVDTLNRYLGEFGIRTIGSSSELSTESFDSILSTVNGQSGISIAAHIVSDAGGLLKVLKGQPRMNAWRNRHLLAVQIPRSIVDLQLPWRHIVENKEPNYVRPNPAGENLALAVVNARDVTIPDDLSHPSATSLIKMSTIGVEGLRQAFLDPDSRIRLSSDPEPENHAELMSISWEGGFLDGTDVRLNPNLNVLVGGRGAGKSTVVESLRYVLGLDPIGDESSKTHRGIVRQVLRSGTKISLRTRCIRPAEREYVVERIVPNPPIVRDESGQVSNLLPEDILPRIEVYGQHEISELSRSREKLTHLLDRFVESDPSLARRKADVRRDLDQTRRSLIDAQEDLNELDSQLGALPAIEEMLQRFEDAGLEDKLREQSQLVREERLLDSIPERLYIFGECLGTLRQSYQSTAPSYQQRLLKDCRVVTSCWRRMRCLTA